MLYRCKLSAQVKLYDNRTELLQSMIFLNFVNFEGNNKRTKQLKFILCKLYSNRKFQDILTYSSTELHASHHVEQSWILPKTARGSTNRAPVIEAYVRGACLTCAATLQSPKYHFRNLSVWYILANPLGMSQNLSDQDHPDPKRLPPPPTPPPPCPSSKRSKMGNGTHYVYSRHNKNYTTSVRTKITTARHAVAQSLPGSSKMNIIKSYVRCQLYA